MRARVRSHNAEAQIDHQILELAKDDIEDFLSNIAFDQS
jgi:hypothetical protein